MKIQFILETEKIRFFKKRMLRNLETVIKIEISMDKPKNRLDKTKEKKITWEVEMRKSPRIQCRKIQEI